MTIEGGPEPPEDGYPDPGKYTPDNLGENKVWESNGRVQVLVPAAAIRHLAVEEGDIVRFTEADGGGVLAEKIESESQ